MGFVDKIKDAFSGHEEEVKSAVDQAGDFVDQKTGGQYAGQVDQAQDWVKDQVDGFAPNPGEQPQP